ncbi:MAG: DUF4372 domain-containing protein [Terriglobia bacterium]
MKKQKTKPANSKISALKQICNFIPGHLVSKLARETGADKKARGICNWSHVVSLLFAQLAHSIGWNDVADALQLHRGALAGIRGAVPPSRNGLSHANKCVLQNWLRNSFGAFSITSDSSRRSSSGAKHAAAPTDSKCVLEGSGMNIEIFWRSETLQEWRARCEWSTKEQFTI